MLQLWRQNRPLVIAAVLACASVAVAPVWRALRVAKEELVFTSAGARLVGTLIKPRGAGPFPAVVFAQDSEEETRAGSKYRLRAERFARDGIAAFVYDRRGRGQSEGDTRRFPPMELLAADAIAAVDALRSRPDIDADHVGISGHSKGAWIAPLAATLSDHIAFVAVSSAPAITPDEQELFALKGRLTDEGRTPDEIFAAMVALRKKTPADRARDLDPTDGERSLDSFVFDPEPVWERVHVPVLAIWGDDDEIVPARKSRRIIERALMNAGNQDVTLETLQGVDHDLAYTSADEFMSEWVLDRVLRSRYGVR